jgi:large subunit ribosomal protein L21
MDYAVVEISGRQYKVQPGKKLSVDFLGEITTLECDKVLLIAKDDNLEIGTPYLSKKLVFDVLGSRKEAKIHVAKFHHKANFRRKTGSRRITTSIQLAETEKKTAKKA